MEADTRSAYPWFWRSCPAVWLPTDTDHTMETVWNVGLHRPKASMMTVDRTLPESWAPCQLWPCFIWHVAYFLLFQIDANLVGGGGGHTGRLTDGWRTTAGRQQDDSSAWTSQVSGSGSGQSRSQEPSIISSRRWGGGGGAITCGFCRCKGVSSWMPSSLENVQLPMGSHTVARYCSADSTRTMYGVRQHSCQQFWRRKRTFNWFVAACFHILIAPLQFTDVGIGSGMLKEHAFWKHFETVGCFKA